jgi:hypothetical protein
MTDTKIKTLNIGQKLGLVQSELKVPKGQFNTFGNYKYRSCEDILEAVKPLLAKYKMLLVMEDKLVNKKDRYYVKATANLNNLEGDFEKIMVSAYAREEEHKKGMDGSQITGASSSYARKYALNGLFGIDDAKDSDTTNKGGISKTNSKENAVVNYTKDGDKYLCSVCNSEMTFRKGVSKAGKNWSALICNGNRKHIIWSPKL